MTPREALTGPPSYRGLYLLLLAGAAAALFAVAAALLGSGCTPERREEVAKVIREDVAPAAKEALPFPWGEIASVVLTAVASALGGHALGKRRAVSVLAKGGAIERRRSKSLAPAPAGGGESVASLEEAEVKVKRPAAGIVLPPGAA